MITQYTITSFIFTDTFKIIYSIISNFFDTSKSYRHISDKTYTLNIQDDHNFELSKYYGEFYIA